MVAIARAAGNRCYPQATTTVVRESLGLGSLLSRLEIVQVASELTASCCGGVSVTGEA